MRFVTPAVVRKTLKDGPNGEKNWIDLKKELTIGEKNAFRTAGFRQLTPGDDAPADGSPKDPNAKDAKIDVDWKALSFARANAYLMEWSAKKSDGKDMPLTRAAIEALDEDDFNEINTVIEAHIAEQAELKKATGGGTTPPTPPA